MLATDLLNYAWKDLYDVAILVSGDGDFAYALQAVKTAGKHVEVAYFGSNVSKSLLEVADNSLLLDSNFFRGLWRSKNRRTRRPRKILRRSEETGAHAPTNSAPIATNAAAPMP